MFLLHKYSTDFILLISKTQIFFGIGVLFVILGLIYFFKLRKFTKEGIITIAKISKYSEDSRGFQVYPIYEFFDQNQKLIRAETTFSIFSFQKDKVKIIYNPKNPKKLMPYHWLVLNGPCIVILIGMVFIYFGIQ